MIRYMAKMGAVLMILMAATTAWADGGLNALSGQVGIWFFYMTTCPYCAREEPILYRISQRYQIPVTAISLNGGPTPQGLFKHYVRDQGQSLKLGVAATPTLFLVHPASHQATKLSVGFIPAGALKQRMVAAAQAAGWLGGQPETGQLGPVKSGGATPILPTTKTPPLSGRNQGFFSTSQQLLGSR